MRVPSAHVETTAASVPLTTADGVALGADLATPTTPSAAAVLLHPHPRFGGDRFDNVVDALFRALPDVGIAALRFDFRPGSGADGGDLSEERADAVTALDVLAERFPGLPLFVVGYSFGAAVGLGVDHTGVRARVAIAPPLAVMRVEPPTPLPTLVLVPAHDQFSPPDTVTPIIATWPSTTMEVVESADHFMAGRAAAVATRAAAWLTTSP